MPRRYQGRYASTVQNMTRKRYQVNGLLNLIQINTPTSLNNKIYVSRERGIRILEISRWGIAHNRLRTTDIEPTFQIFFFFLVNLIVFYKSKRSYYSVKLTNVSL